MEELEVIEALEVIEDKTSNPSNSSITSIPSIPSTSSNASNSSNMWGYMNKNLFKALIIAALSSNFSLSALEKSSGASLESKMDSVYSDPGEEQDAYRPSLSYVSKDRNEAFRDLKQLSRSSEPSAFEKFVGGSLKQFGYDFFYKSPSSFAPDQNVPVTPDYIVGPGDQIVVTLWGRLNARWSLEVSREGTLSLPKMGVINPAGVQFKDLREFLKKEISRYYTDFDLNVSMGNLRSIRVYLVGNVSSPGAYTIPGLSTVISALFESGGPSKTGTMRAVELKRSGKTISTLDLYALLLKGDKSGDFKLVNEDVVYVPPVGPLVAVSTGVRNPAIYELKKDEKLLDLITMAGGFSNTAYSRKVAIKRIFDSQYTDYFEADIADVEQIPEKNIPLRDGDSVTVNSVIKMDSSVNVSGAVAYPGRIGIKQRETTLKDAVMLAGGKLPHASDVAEITRFKAGPEGVNTERFVLDLKKALEGEGNNNIQLMPYDSIVVKSVSNWYSPKSVEIAGEVQSPGSYVLEKGEKIYSVLKRANGFTDKAYPQGVVFIRESVREQQQKNLEEIVNRLEKELFSGASADISTALSAEEMQSKKEVLEQKRNFLAKLREAKASGRVYIRVKSLEKLKNSEYNLELQEGDKIIIPAKSDVVNVSGSVMAQGSYVYDSGGYKKYINMAGGFSYYADKGRTFILRADGSAQKAKSCIFGSSKVGPGDTVVVPEKFERIAWLREIRDITQIITNLALTTGIVIKVF